MKRVLSMQLQPEAQTTKEYAYCDRCGSPEIETIKRRVGAAEKLTILLIPLFVVIGAVLGFYVFVFGMALLDTWHLETELTLIGFCASFLLILPAGGAVLGTLLGRALIRRRRRNKNLSQTTYHCKMCRHIFIPKIKENGAS